MPYDSPLERAGSLQHFENPEPVIPSSHEDFVTTVIKSNLLLQVREGVSLAIFPNGDAGSVLSDKNILYHEQHIPVQQPVVIPQEQPSWNCTEAS